MRLFNLAPPATLMSVIAGEAGVQYPGAIETFTDGGDYWIP
jgi:hypothetical protein